MRVLITGSRDWDDRIVIARALLEVPHLRPTLVHGGAKGADRIAMECAYEMEWDIEVHPAIWRPHGIYNPQAGLVRNRKMVDLGADLCLAFIRNGSRGASHCARLAEEAGIPTRRYTA